VTLCWFRVLLVAKHLWQSGHRKGFSPEKENNIIRPGKFFEEELKTWKKAHVDQSSQLFGEHQKMQQLPLHVHL
jgi:hypothetical protein